jgi:uncharacterized membrane protein
MALDHVRDYLGNRTYDPSDLPETSPVLFATRWVTHFCAPVFVFLAGTGVYLSQSRGKSRREIQTFLVTRGLWLVVLEITVIRFCWFFTVDYQLTVLQVIWAIGCSMIVLAVLLPLP